MLDLKQIRENPEEVQKRLDSRGGSYDIAPILQLNQQQKALEQERSSLQARGNEIGKLVGQKVKSGSDVNSPEILAMKTEGNEIKSKLAQLEPKNYSYLLPTGAAVQTANIFRRILVFVSWG